MSATVIGIDPHKRSHTAVVLDDCEQVAAEIRVAASAKRVDELLGWAPTGQRVWAIENANGLGRLRRSSWGVCSWSAAGSWCRNVNARSASSTRC